MSVKLTNIKVSIKTNLESLDSVEKKIEKKSLFYKRYNNFIVIKDNFVYTIFRPGKNKLNHINVTKIKSIDDIDKAIENLNFFGLSIIKSSLNIDNITGSFNLKKEVYLKKVIEIIQEDEQFRTIKVSYNNEKFPGLFLKVKEIGTIIIFYSGKVVFVGCKTLTNLECLASLTRVLTKQR